MPPIKKQALGMVVGLAVQFLLGMATNLYVSFPESGNGTQMWEFAKTQPLVWAHIIVGTLLLLNSFFILFRAVKLKDQIWKIVAGFGVLGIIGAFFAGERFVSTQSDFYSLLMAISFIVAVLAYTLGIYQSK